MKRYFEIFAFGFAIIVAGVLTWRLTVGCQCGGNAADAATPVEAAAPATSALESVWPRYRGNPQLQGVSKATLPDEPVLKWTFKTGDGIKSSPVISFGKVYIGSDDGSVYALDQKTGRKVWSFKTEDAVEAPPTVHGSRLYVGSDDGEVYCLDAETGELKWKYATDDKIVGAVNVTARPDGRTVAVVGSHDTYLHCIDAETGEPVWKYETSNFINGTPVVAEGMTMFGGCDGLIHVVSVADGKKVREIEIGGYVIGSAAAFGPTVYVGHYGNEFVAADIREGKILWTYKDRSFPFASSPAVTDTQVVFGGRDKQVHCVNRADGKRVWRFGTRGQVDSSPVIVGDKVVVGSSDGRLYILNLKDGTQTWSYEVGDAITGSPAVVNGLIVVGCDDGNVYAFGDKE
ncbi:MAG: PQQ-binding-like beta-propeller repeat protein [Phycisphaera sp.]|nr:PQQ-binding-like beta-propeller repeat protein [Phycisphaera sp.]